MWFLLIDYLKKNKCYKNTKSIQVKKLLQKYTGKNTVQMYTGHWNVRLTLFSFDYFLQGTM